MSADADTGVKNLESVLFIWMCAQIEWVLLQAMTHLSTKHSEKVFV